MNLRNIAIIAHVDHGKTTLVDKLLSQSGSFRENQRVAERVMDSNDLEKERGITILAKATSVVWKDTRINIVDTPGHADFGGEVERILSMVDGVIVLVDAAKARCRRPSSWSARRSRSGSGPSSRSTRWTGPTPARAEVINEVFDLFAALDATDEQLDFRSCTGPAATAGCRPPPNSRRCEPRAAVRPRAEARAAGERGGGRLPHARDAAGGEPVPRPHHHG
jgi:GTP-binding protein